LKALSNILGTAIGIMFITAVLVAFVSYFNSASNTAFRMLHAEKENIYVKMYSNTTGTYVLVMNPGPVSPVTIRYIILKDINSGNILSVYRLWRSIEVGESFAIKVSNSTMNNDDLVAIAVSSNGAVFYEEETTTNYQEYNNLTNNDNNEFLVNPIIGWAFNKSLAVQDSDGNVYYIIPYLIGDHGWNNNITDMAYEKYQTSITMRFYDTSNNDKLIIYIKIYAFKDPFDSSLVHCQFYFVYSDGSEKKIAELQARYGERVSTSITPSLFGKGITTNSYSYFNITDKLVTTRNVSEISLTFEPLDYDPARAYVRIGMDYSYQQGFWYLHVLAKNSNLYMFIRKIGKNIFLEANESTNWLYMGKVFQLPIFRWWSYYVYINPPPGPTPPEYTYVDFYVSKNLYTELFWVVNPSQSYNVSINVPYFSYDLYVIDVNGKAQSTYIRPSDQVIYIGYNNYLLPGYNEYIVNCTVPEIYSILIKQSDSSLPSYLIIINWIDPRLFLDIVGGGEDLLVKYGLIDTGANISFKYWSLVFKNGSFLGNFSSGSTITLTNDVYAVIPIEGPYKGNIIYLWVDSWKLIHS